MSTSSTGYVLVRSPRPAPARSIGAEPFPSESRASLRRTELVALVLLALFSFGISAKFAVAAPPLWYPDERPHAAYAVEVWQGNLPTINTPVVDDLDRYPQISDSLATQRALAGTCGPGAIRHFFLHSRWVYSGCPTCSPDPLGAGETR
jgi:hypothetical protein